MRKSMIFMAMMVAPLTALANLCPDISGTYEATLEDAEGNTWDFSLTMNNQVIGQVRRYSNDGGRIFFTADGVTRTVDVPGHGSVQATAICPAPDTYVLDVSKSGVPYGTTKGILRPGGRELVWETRSPNAPPLILVLKKN